MISSSECKKIRSSHCYFSNKKKLNRLKINNAEIDQGIEAMEKIAAPKIGKAGTENHSLPEQKPSNRNFCGN